MRRATTKLSRMQRLKIAVFFCGEIQSAWHHHCNVMNVSIEQTDCHDEAAVSVHGMDERIRRKTDPEMLPVPLSSAVAFDVL